MTGLEGGNVTRCHCLAISERAAVERSLQLGNVPARGLVAWFFSLSVPWKDRRRIYADAVLDDGLVSVLAFPTSSSGLRTAVISLRDGNRVVGWLARPSLLKLMDPSINRWKDGAYILHYFVARNRGDRAAPIALAFH